MRASAHLAPVAAIRSLIGPRGGSSSNVYCRTIYYVDSASHRVEYLYVENQGGFSFPAFDHPTQLLGLLLGQDVDLVKYDAGRLHGDLGPPLDGLSFPSTEALPVEVPDIGDFTDVPIIEILVSPGDTVQAEDPLVTLESG